MEYSAHHHPVSVLRVRQVMVRQFMYVVYLTVVCRTADGENILYLLVLDSFEKK